MQKLIKREKLLLFAAVSSAFAGAFSIAGIIFFILKLMYLPMAVCILICAHGFYGTPIYLMRRADVKCARLIITAVNSGERSLKDISEHAGVKSEFGAKIIGQLLEKGYITDLTLEGELLV